MELSEPETFNHATELYKALAKTLSLNELAVEDGRACLSFGEDSEQVEVELEARAGGWLYVYAPLQAPAHWDETTLRRTLNAALEHLAGASLAISQETGTPLLMMALPLTRLDAESLAEILDGFVAQAVALSKTDLATALASQTTQGGQATGQSTGQSTENQRGSEKQEEILRI